MAKTKNTPQTLDLATLSQEELLAKATELQASNETLTDTLEGLNKSYGNLSDTNEELNKSVEALEKEKSEALISINDQKAILENATKKIEELETVIAELSVANTVKVKGNEISFKGNVYDLITPKFYIGEKLITREILESDEELIAKAIEAGNLKKVKIEKEGEA